MGLGEADIAFHRGVKPGDAVGPRSEARAHVVGMEAETFGRDGGQEAAERPEMVARRRMADARAGRDGAQRQGVESLLLEQGHAGADEFGLEVAVVIGTGRGIGHVDSVNISSGQDKGIGADIYSVNIGSGVTTVTPESLFALMGPPVLVGWAILILGPRRFGVLNVLPGLAIPLGLSLLYTALVLRHFAETGGGYGSLAEVRMLFGSDWMLLAGWVHYLAFDMMVGAVLAGRMDRAGIGRLVQGPILAVTFLFGPMGVVIALVTEGALRLPGLGQPGKAVTA